jgi:asparagine synthase (glutamine-hydrolysing)
MCGIAGIIDQRRPPDEGAIRAMLETFAYRGPDGSGVEVLDKGGVAFGHRRLSILDLSDAGRQPMSSQCGRYVVTYNGEIYNYLEIQRELAALGCTFRSHSDTEVLLKAYETWGAECLSRFMGMYAFAIWDRNRQELFAARDRLGIKPFYYAETPGGLAFASEIKALLPCIDRFRNVDPLLIDAYMEFGYVPGAQTMHPGVQRLKPGHSLTWRQGALSIAKYWDLTFDDRLQIDLKEATKLVDDALKDSIRLHQRSDVPLGVLLSGGLDSSAVVSMLTEAGCQRLKTFSVAYDFGREYDETPFAEEVARTFRTDHHTYRISPKDFVDQVPDFICKMDEPVTEAAAISLYFVCKMARRDVTVCLSGEGSDELFAGYGFYGYNRAVESARRILGQGIFRVGARLVPGNGRLAKLRKYMELASEPLEARYRGISSYTKATKERLYSEDMRRSTAGDAAPWKEFLAGIHERSRNWDPLSRMLYFDTKTWLVDDLLIKADRMSMANSVELRVPFLDHRLVELAARLPSAFKTRFGREKIILKKVMEGRLPESVIHRKKLGFPTPLEQMFKGELYGYARDLLQSREFVERGYFNPAVVSRMLDEHLKGVAKHHREIWQLVVLEEWHRRFGY